METLTSNGGSKHQQRGRSPSRVIPFGKYLLLERIAVGGMAEVFLAKTFGIEGFEKIIAVKRILPTMAEDREFIEMFIDEAKIAGQLSHASIVPIYELGRIGESHYIAMEFVWGKDLLQIMNRCRRLRWRLDPQMCAYIASKLCEGLDYAHNRRGRDGKPLDLIHRDISPQNVLVGYEAEVKLIDFGIAKATSRNTKTQAGVLKGKFGYMSPEQIRGRKIDARSDCFALGTCMYEMLTSERLFMGESDFTTLERVRNADVTPPSSVVPVPTDLENIIMKALTREPADRWSSAAEMHAALQVFLASQPKRFTASDLSAWMGQAFADEKESEKSRLDSYAKVGRQTTVGKTSPAAAPAPAHAAHQHRETLGRSDDEVTAAARPLPRETMPATPEASPPTPEASAATEDDLDSLFGDAAYDDEQTILSASPFASMLEQGDDDPLAEQKTQIFFTIDDFELIEEGDDEPVAPQSKAARALEAIVGPRPDLHTPSPVHPQHSPTEPLSLEPIPPSEQPPASDAFALGVNAATPISAMGPAAGVGAHFAPALGTLSHPRDTRLLPVEKKSPARLVGLAVLCAAVIICGAWFATTDRPGQLSVRTFPAAGATVRIDNEIVGVTPSSYELDEGTHRLEITLSGWQPVSRDVHVTGGSDNSIDIHLTTPTAATPNTAPPVTPTDAPSPELPTEVATGEGATPPTELTPDTESPLDTESPPDIASSEDEPVVTAEPSEPTPPPIPTPVEAHERVEALAREAAADPTAPVTPTPTRITRNAEPTGRPRPVARDPAARPPPPTMGQTPEPPAPAPSPEPVAAPTHGTLTINSIPWSDVTLDGRPIGRTPIFNRRVRSGSHRIQMQTPDGERHGFTVNVPGGETVRVSRRFE